MQKQLLSKIKPLIYVEENRAYSNNGSILHGYRLILPEIYTLSEKDYEEIHAMWYKALRDFPTNIIIHKMDVYLKGKFHFEEKGSGSFLSRATERHFEGRETISHYSFLFFMYPNHQILNSAKIQNPFKRPVKTIEAIEKTEKSNKFFEEDVKKAEEFINASRHMQLERLSSEEFRYLEHAYFNGFYEDRITDLDLKKSRVGDKHIGIFSLSNLNQYGETVKTSIEDASMSEREWIYHQGFMDDLAIKLNCDHIYNQIIFIKDHHYEKKKIEKQKDDFVGSRKFSREYKRDAEKLDEYLDEIADNEKIILVYGHNNLIYYSGDQAEYESLSFRIPNLFKAVDIMPYYPVGKNKSNLIANSFPGFVGNIDSDNFYGPIDLQQCLCLFTNVGPYRNDENGVYFNDRILNVPVIKDIWDKDRKRIKARNFFVIAPTGEGKSVLFNHIARQMYEKGVSIVIIDLGGSYRKLSLLYPDDTIYIRYKEGEPIGLNPFKIEKGETITTLDGFYSYLWSTGSTTNTTTVSPTVTTTYGLTVTNGYGCINEADIKITVDNPNTDFTASMENIRPGDPVQFVVNSINETSEYKWTFGDNTNGIGPDIIHYYYEEGVFDVRLDVLSENNCAALNAKLDFINVNENNSGVSVKENNLDILGIKLYPVPVRSVLQIDASSYNKTSKIDFSIYSSSGKLMSIFMINPKDIYELSMSDYPNGQYIVMLRVNGIISSQKIVKID